MKIQSVFVALGGVFTAVLGVPFAVVVASAAGTLAGILIGDPIEPRRKLYGYAFGLTVGGAALVAIVPDYMGWTWATQNADKLAPLALVLSFAGRWLLPAFIANVGPWLTSVNPFKRKA